MAKLGPPNIASMVPSFYTDLNGTTEIVVPFSMNSTVSRAAVSGLLLRIKRTTVDTTVDTLYTENWDDQNFSVKFILAQDSSTIKKLVKGQYYKLQLAYGQKLSDGTISAGYYSTVAIAKYTEYPAAIVQELEPGVTNSVNQITFHGRYDNTDISERAYQYRFIINSSKRNEITHQIEQKTFLDTDWLIHDSSNDTELSSSIDILTLTEMFDTAANYTLQYKVLTNNGLEVASPQYSLQSTVAVGEELELVLKTELDYENGRMKIGFLPTGEQHYFTGNYYLERTDSKSNFKNWLILYSFQSYEAIKDFVFYDYTIESGMAYKYGIQRINQANILSQRTQSNYPIVGYFEDCFLYDGYKQLKIRYNTNISSFKEIISETKKTTLGSKYPVIFRNGLLCYKEFPITGLLSYLSDPDELFCPRSDLLSDALLEARARTEVNEILTKRPRIQTDNEEGLPRRNPQIIGYDDFRESTDQTDENVTAERNFAMLALSWMNNGTIKLFRSPQEGNFIVKLMNVSLAPFQGTNRMIHSFTATADEVQDFTTDALVKYDLMPKGTGDTEGHTYIDTVKIVDLAQIRESVYATYAYSDENLSDAEKFRRYCAAIEKFDLTDGQPVTKIRFECRKDANARIFKWGDTTFALGVDGTYVMEQDKPYIGSLTVVSYTSNKQELSTLAGKLYLTVRVDTSVTIENVSSQKVITYFGWSGYGNELASGASGQSRNLLQDFVSNKYLVTECYKTVTHSFPEYAEANLAGQWNSDVNERDRRVLRYGNYIIYHDLSTDKYYRCRVSDKTLYEITPNKRIRTKDPENDLVDITEYGSGGENIVNINYNNLDEVYWTIGNDVYTCFFFAVNKINYSIEEDADLNPLKINANTYKREWFKYTFNLVEIGSKPTAADNKLLFIWSGDRFVQIALENWNNYVGDYTIYTIYDGIYSASSINTAYSNYRAAEQALETGIKNRLDTASGEGG